MTDNLSNTTFLQRLQEGDLHAEEQLFHQYAPRLIEVAEKNLGKILKRRLDAEDVVQSVFRTFYRRNADGEFRVENMEKLWRLLVKITVLKMRQKARQHTAGKRDVRAETRPVEDTPLETPIPDPGPAEATALVELVEALLQGLHATYAQVVEMRLGGYSAVEIAKEMDISRPTVYRALERAQERLQKILTEESVS